MKYDAIFFDFDGVIVDSIHIKTQVFYEMYLPYGKNIADKAKQHHIENGGISRFEKFKLYHKDFLGKTLNNDDLEQLASEFSLRVKNAVIESKIVPGVIDLLEELYNSLDLFIITGTPTEEIIEIIEKRGWTKYFKEILGSPTNKDNWSKYLLNKYHYNQNKVLFIGDATTDYDAAKLNDFDFALRTHNENKPLFKNKNVYKFKDFTEFKLENI
ncbi:MAG: hypothetical protein CMD20_05015 [Flavobacteriales bacterium]|nr:hypothetical protein [Flavobacteriales bacterium]